MAKLPFPKRIPALVGPLLALLLLIVGTTVAEWMLVAADDRVFLTATNFSKIIGQHSIVGIVAVGMTFVIILGGIDLSVGAMAALAAGAAVLTLNGIGPERPGLAVAGACAVCVVGGGVLGLVNGMLVSWGRIAPFVATLGTMAAFRSLVTVWADASEIRPTVSGFQTIGNATVGVPWLGAGGDTLEIRASIPVFLTLAALAHLVLTRTVFGRRVFAIGDNPTSARYAGIPIGQTTVGVFAVAGLCCGIAALMISSRMNSVGSTSLGMGYELDAIAAVVIGGTRLQGGRGTVAGTVVGVLIIGVVSNMLTMLEVSTYWQGLVKGVIIIAAVFIQRFGRSS
ncbi:MAG: ABC transporter permease [Phycisphaerales bacterium]